MSTLKQVVGPAVAEWHKDAPLRWTMSETIGKGKHAELIQFSFDLTPLLPGYSLAFLLALKECWIDNRMQLALVSISSSAYAVQAVLQACHERITQICRERAITSPVFERINSDLLMGLWAVQDSVPRSYLRAFKNLHKKHGHNSAIFEAGLYPGNLPMGGRVPVAFPHRYGHFR